MAAETKEKSAPPVDATRNAKLRELVKKPIERGMRVFHQIFPRVDPNHITAGGSVFIGAGVAVLEYQNRTNTRTVGGRIAGGELIGVGGVTDGFDGGLAR